MMKALRRPKKQPRPAGIYFHFHAALRISGNNLDLEEISSTLGLSPTHSHRKGERKSPLSKPWREDMWVFEPRIRRNKPLDKHITALWKAIRPKISYLRKLKRKSHVDVFCGYHSNSDSAGFELDNRCLGLFTELDVPFGVSVIIS